MTLHLRLLGNLLTTSLASSTKRDSFPPFGGKISLLDDDNVFRNGTSLVGAESLVLLTLV